MPDLSAELRGGRGGVGGDAARTQRPGHGVAPAPVGLVEHGHQHRGRDGAGGGDRAVAEQPRHEPADADAQAHARVTGGPFADQVVVPPARADRTEVLAADQLGLVDAAGVVVQATDHGQVGDHHPGGHGLGGVDEGLQVGQGGVELVRPDPQPVHEDVEDRQVGALDSRQLEHRVGLLPAGPRPLTQKGPDRLRTDLGQLVHRGQDRGHVGQVETPHQRLDDPPVVHPHPDPAHVEPLQRLDHDQRQVDLVVPGQGVDADHVHVGLHELPETAVLRPLPAP